MLMPNKSLPILLLAGLLAACATDRRNPPPAAGPPAPPDLAALAAGLGAGLAPMPDQAAEQRRLVDRQVAAASHMLDSPEAEAQIAGAEQLAAYPTPEAERALLRFLDAPRRAEAQVAALRALMAFKEPEAATVALLLKAVEWRGEGVQAAALASLSAYLDHLDPGSARFREVYRGLEGAARSKRVEPAVRQGIRDMLAGFPPLG